MSDSPPLKAQVVVGRRWHQPEVYAMVSVDKIEMTMTLEDLVRVISYQVKETVDKQCEETKWYALITRWSFRKKLQQLDLHGLVTRVAGEVVDEIKQASTHVV